jgi:TolB-like protein
VSASFPEEILNLLASIPELRVISRSSAFSFKGEDPTIAEVAEKLNVAHVLEGSVRKSGKQLRITAQLIEARSDTHLWSETYDRTLDDIFAIQDEIAAKVVEQLKVTLLGDAPRTRKTNPEAYALWLQAHEITNHRVFESLPRAEEMLQRALEIDPEYALAWSELAAVYSYQGIGQLRELDEADLLSRQAIEQALAVDPDNSFALAQNAWVAMFRDFNLEQAARGFERALELDPGNVATNRLVQQAAHSLEIWMQP